MSLYQNEGQDAIVQIYKKRSRKEIEAAIEECKEYIHKHHYDRLEAASNNIGKGITYDA